MHIAHPARKPRLHRVVVRPLAALAFVALSAGCSLFAPDARDVVVLDAATGEPLVGAEVKIRFRYGLGNAHKGTFTTGSDGVVTIATRARPESMLWDIDRIRVTAKGYHFNGIIRPKGRSRYEITLQRFVDPAPLVIVGVKGPDGPMDYGNVAYHEGDALDLLALVPEGPQVHASLEATAANVPHDLLFAEIGNAAAARNSIGPGWAVVECPGLGGIQEVEGRRAEDVYYSLENLISAPRDGYEKSLRLKDGAPYVGRTRDGQRYFKFIPFFSKDLKGRPYARLMLWLQPRRTVNLEGR